MLCLPHPAASAHGPPPEHPGEALPRREPLIAQLWHTPAQVAAGSQANPGVGEGVFPADAGEG